MVFELYRLLSQYKHDMLMGNICLKLTTAILKTDDVLRARGVAFVPEWHPPSRHAY